MKDQVDTHALRFIAIISLTSTMKGSTGVSTVLGEIHMVILFPNPLQSVVQK